MASTAVDSTCGGLGGYEVEWRGRCESKMRAVLLASGESAKMVMVVKRWAERGLGTHLLAIAHARFGGERV